MLSSDSELRLVFFAIHGIRCIMPTLTTPSTLNDIKSRGQHTCRLIRVGCEFFECQICHGPDSFICMLEGMAYKQQVVAIKLHSLNTPDRFVMQDVDVSLHSTAQRVSYSASKTKPARQAKHCQSLRYSLSGCEFSWDGAKVGTKLFISRKGCDAICVNKQSEDLPSIALKR
ncbi:hypothetical protein ALO42_200003 [Pseudomonas syringae pv. atrofaciens]|nr:hypothetical protein ALO42_200003 [Pseudomonas syringae pv. atrofaciens]